jgi:coiled-coil domain-containing protein 12
MDDRSARLAALAAKAGRSSQQPSIDGGGHDQEDASSSSKPTITFRNYVPKDPSLEVKSSTGETPLDNAHGDDAELLSTNKRQKRSSSEKTTKQTALELALAKTSRESREAAGQNVGTNGGWGSITAVATKKVNWDLKRDVQHRLDRLEKRTQRAIVELLRERLEREAGEVANDDDGGDDDSDLD